MGRSHVNISSSPARFTRRYALGADERKLCFGLLVYIRCD